MTSADAVAIEDSADVLVIGVVTEMGADWVEPTRERAALADPDVIDTAEAVVSGGMDVA